MTRRGFTLVAILWLLVLAGSLVSYGLARGRLGAAVSRNRVTLLRAEWAREACLDILEARFSSHRSPFSLDTVDLGGGTWCYGILDDPQSKVNVNLAPPVLLHGLLGSDSLVDALLDWRDPDSEPRAAGAEASWYRAQGRAHPRNGGFADVTELRLVRGFEDIADSTLVAVFTIHGNGRINLRTASPRILRAAGYGPETIALILASRKANAIASWDNLVALVPGLATLTSDRLVATVEGGVRGESVASRAEVVFSVAWDRLAILTRAVR